MGERQGPDIGVSPKSIPALSAEGESVGSGETENTSVGTGRLSHALHEISVHIPHVHIPLPHIHVPQSVPHLPHFHMPHLHMPHIGRHNHPDLPHLEADFSNEEASKHVGLHFTGQFMRMRNVLNHRVVARERAMVEVRADAAAVAMQESLKPPSSPRRPSMPNLIMMGKASPPMSSTHGIEGVLDGEEMTTLPPAYQQGPLSPGGAPPTPDKKPKLPPAPTTIQLNEMDYVKGFVYLLACLFAIGLTIGWRPHPARHDLHQTKLARYGISITSPLYAVSMDEHLVLGGRAGAPLSPGSSHAMLDLKMVLPCTNLRSACLNPSSESSHRRRTEEAKRSARRLSVTEDDGQGSTGADTHLPSATITWEFWHGEPGLSASRKWTNGSIDLQTYSETEFLLTVVPFNFGVQAEDDIYLRVSAMNSDHSSYPYNVLVEVTQLTDFGAWRVLVAGLTFLLIFGLILSEVINRVYSTMVGAILVVGLNSLVYDHQQELQVVLGHVDWPTLVLLFSMMILVHLLSLTGFFEWCAVRVAVLAKGNATTVFIMLSSLAGILSAFLDNVTCVMLLGPVTISLCKQMKVPSVPFYLTETLAATVGGTATLVGDPPNVVISQVLGFGFVDFLAHNGVLVFLILLPVTILVQYLRFRSQLNASTKLTPEMLKQLTYEHPIIDQRSLMYVGCCLIGLFIGLPVSEVTHVEPAFYCFLFTVGACLTVSRHSIRHLLEAVEWDTLLFFACLFIIVEGLVELGLVRAVGNGLTAIISAVPLESRLSVACLLFLWVSSLGSAFFESLPYTATIAAVLKNMQFSETPIGIPLTPLGWALSVGACVGGIGSIMGSSANLVALAVSHRYSPDEAIEGKHFLQYGLPLLFILTLITSLWQYIMFTVLAFPGAVEQM